MPLTLSEQQLVDGIKKNGYHTDGMKIWFPTGTVLPQTHTYERRRLAAHQGAFLNLDSLRSKTVNNVVYDGYLIQRTKNPTPVTPK